CRRLRVLRSRWKARRRTSRPASRRPLTAGAARAKANARA
ncbi:MAG: hypothetical protein AVDCRST_MAG05-4668, partial [uncultured Rubrobacteraceae bacterium]